MSDDDETVVLDSATVIFNCLFHYLWGLTPLVSVRLSLRWNFTLTYYRQGQICLLKRTVCSDPSVPYWCFTVNRFVLCSLTRGQQTDGSRLARTGLYRSVWLRMSQYIAAASHSIESRKQTCPSVIELSLFLHWRVLPSTYIIVTLLSVTFPHITDTITDTIRSRV